VVYSPNGKAFGVDTPKTILGRLCAKFSTWDLAVRAPTWGMTYAGLHGVSTPAAPSWGIETARKFFDVLKHGLRAQIYWFSSSHFVSLKTDLLIIEVTQLK
jgi:hypothetical protein